VGECDQPPLPRREQAKQRVVHLAAHAGTRSVVPSSAVVLPPAQGPRAEVAAPVGFAALLAPLPPAAVTEKLGMPGTTTRFGPPPSKSEVAHVPLGKAARPRRAGRLAIPSFEVSILHGPMRPTPKSKSDGQPFDGPAGDPDTRHEDAPSHARVPRPKACSRFRKLPAGP
jgi:hypothetical protein